ncbi:hypothetical protein CONPUDRAFT_153794 [Coniophora puteana RWD-64-598 SS2]|uniref:Homeobox domain-containing protein n=1 Tax=Coniophora puteana (strain RWD-64-598) TaxID=741705 RepID=A0A5M3MRG2_CONPW|nr:uncharacterized protein CONPUDRAFT_153794 [Coniophora puteana RWD-64-598 SS2]EIW81245.1 hypothetical protein CONPUDRAFT_153794 [Coniophora puteana RWD-64-598 SS2]
MSTSTASAPDTESSVPSRGEKRVRSPSSSPQPARHRPAPTDSNDQWQLDAASNQSNDKSAVEPGVDTKIQLPSIFAALDDPYRNEMRRSSLPINPDSNQGRHRHSPYPSPSLRKANPPGAQPNVGSYHFPSSDIPQSSDDKASGRPRLDTHLNYSYGEPSPYGNTQLPGSAPASVQVSSSPAFASSQSVSESRSQGTAPPGPPGPYSDHPSWHNAPGGVVRPSSTPGHNANGGHGQKYDDSIRHGSFSAGSNPSPPYSNNGGRISGPPERRGFTGGSGGKPDDWSFPPQDYVLPPGNSNSYNANSSPTPVPQLAPAPVSSGTPISRSPQQGPVSGSTLVDRPTRKRGKLPKETTDYLKAWLHRHSDHPYPSEEEKKQLCHATGLSMSQVSNWMINARRRILAPIHKAQQAPTTSAPYPPSSRQPAVPSMSDPMNGRRQSGAGNDSLQLYHPMSLQSMPATQHGSAGNEYLGPNSRSLLGQPVGRGTHPYNGGNSMELSQNRAGLSYGPQHGQSGGHSNQYLSSTMPISAGPTLPPNPYGSQNLAGHHSQMYPQHHSSMSSQYVSSPSHGSTRLPPHPSDSQAHGYYSEGGLSQGHSYRALND